MIRVLEVDIGLLERCDTSGLEALLGEIEKDPEQVRMFQGNLGFRFRGVEPKDEEMLLMDPAILAWGRQAYERIPHLLYYMFPAPSGEVQALLSLAFGGAEYALTSETTDKDTIAAETAALVLPVLSEHLLAAAVFAERMADDWKPIVAAHCRLAGPELARSILNTVEASMLLEEAALRSSDPPG